MRLATILILAVLSFARASARDVEAQLEESVKDLRSNQRDYAEMKSRARELRNVLKQMQQDGGASNEKSRLRAELTEAEEVLETVARRGKEIQARARELQSSPQHQLLKAVLNDKRKPTKDDISGVWASEHNLTGYTLLLEQRGMSVTGQGYYWGCLGMYDTFEVAGTYKTGVLSLNFTPARPKQQKITFRYSPVKGEPGFISKAAGRVATISPFHGG